jgi:hypothetical protein
LETASHSGHNQKASNITIADALNKIEKLAGTQKRESVIQMAAQLIRKDAKQAKRMQLNKDTTEDSSVNISLNEAAKMIPKTLFNLCVTLLSENDLLEGPDGRLSCGSDLSDKALNLSQQILYAICKTPTPLTLGSAFHIYNETRGKGLMTLMNHMNSGVSYDTFQRILTAICH